MNLTYFLRQVQKPARYISIEHHNFPINSGGEAVGLFYNGSYEESITSLGFQSLVAVFAESAAFRPFRYFTPENDFLELAASEEHRTLWSVDEMKPISDLTHIVLYSDGHSASKLAAVGELFQLNTFDVAIVNSRVLHPLFPKLAAQVLLGEDPYKLKTLVKNAGSFAELSANFGGGAPKLLSDFTGFGSLTKPIVPIIPVRSLAAEYRYVLGASEAGAGELFKAGKPADAMAAQYAKKLDKLTENMPAENELSLFPLGVSNRLRQIESLQKTYLEIFPTIKKVLAAGWRTIHLFFWMGHPLEEKDDWREFKREIQAIADFIQIYKKITVQLHFIGYTPAPRSCFLWDDFMDEAAFTKNRESISSLVESKKNFRATFEPFENYADRLLAARLSESQTGELFNRLKEIGKSGKFSSLGNTLGAFLTEHNSLTAGQAFSHEEFNFVAVENYEELRSKRTDLSKIIAEKMTDEDADLDLKLIKKARLNAHIHLSKTNDMAAASLGQEEMSYGRSVKLRASQAEDISKKYRIMFLRTDFMAFYSNVDARAILLKALAAASIPVRMTKGFTPMPKIAFSAPSTTGVELLCEYADVEVNSIRSLDLKSELNAHLPNGMEVLAFTEVHPKAASLASAITLMEFQLTFEEGYVTEKLLHELEHGNGSIVRETKNSRLELEVSSFLHRISAEGNTVTVELLTSDNRLLKIEELVDVLAEIKPVRFGDISVVKTKQFIFDGENYGDPMDA